MSVRRAVLICWALAAVALVVAVLTRHHAAEPVGWFSYVPLDDSAFTQRYDAWSGLGALDSRLWLGAALGLAIAGGALATQTCLPGGRPPAGRPCDR